MRGAYGRFDGSGMSKTGISAGFEGIVGATGFEPVKAEPADLQCRRDPRFSLKNSQFLNHWGANCGADATLMPIQQIGWLQGKFGLEVLDHGRLPFGAGGPFLAHTGH